MPPCGIRQVMHAVAGDEAITGRVASGSTTRAGSHPWLAGIHLATPSGDTRHYCGAIVLSEMHVLTAAHCVASFPSHVFRVKVGDWDLYVSILDYNLFLSYNISA